MNADLDVKALEQLRSLDAPGSNELFKRLVETFVNDTPKLLVKVADAIAAQDWKMASKHAHAVKGSAGNFGARRLVALCMDIEQAGHSDDSATILRAATHLQLEYESARDALLIMSQQG